MARSICLCVCWVVLGVAGSWLGPASASADLEVEPGHALDPDVRLGRLHVACTDSICLVTGTLIDANQQSYPGGIRFRLSDFAVLETYRFETSNNRVAAARESDVFLVAGTLTNLPRVMGIRIRASDGLRLDNTAFQINEGRRTPEFGVASDGRDFLVAYEQWEAPFLNIGVVGLGARNIYARLIRASGLRGTARRADSGGNVQRDPSVAWNGSEYLVVYHEDLLFGNSAIKARRFADDGRSVGSIFTIERRPSSLEWDFALAGGSNGFALAQRDGEIGGAYFADMRTLDATGRLTGDEHRFHDEARVPSTTRVIFDGRSFLTLYGVNHGDDPAGGHYDLRVARMGTDGSALLPTSQRVARAGWSASSFDFYDVAVTGDGESLLAFVEPRPGGPVGSVVLHRLTDLAPPPPGGGGGTLPPPAWSCSASPHSPSRAPNPFAGLVFAFVAFGLVIRGRARRHAGSRKFVSFR